MSQATVDAWAHNKKMLIETSRMRQNEDLTIKFIQTWDLYLILAGRFTEHRGIATVNAIYPTLTSGM